MRKIVLIFLLHIFSLSCYSQKEDFVWRVGYNLGIDFNGGTPDTFSVNKFAAMDYTSASTCDSSGNLLFFTNGIVILNKYSDTLLNGNNLNPGTFTSSYALNGLPITQADIIVRRPDHQEQYYLFHETFDNDPALQTNILYLTVVDMTLDSGRGAVNGIKNFHLYENDTLIPGKLSVVRHANGRDWWLISKKDLSPVFYKWLIMPDTIIGPMIQNNIQGAGSSFPGFGQTCFSPQGDKYAAIYTNKYFYLYDFDRCTGDLNYLFSTHLNDSSNWGNGCAFSSSGRYLYVATQFFVYQYDMLAGNIGASKTTVAVYDGFASPQPPLFTRFNLMRLAPDNKIYICTDNGCDVLHVIEYPDSSGLACNLQQHSFYLPAIGSVLSLPNIPDYNLGPLSEGCDSSVTIPENIQENLNLVAYPSPSNGIISVGFNTMTELIYTFSLSDVEGRVILEASDRALPGSNIKNIDITKFATGVYFLRLQSESLNKIVRILKD